jgi:hypothetical protein
VTSLRLSIGSMVGEKGLHWFGVGGPDNGRCFQIFKFFLFVVESA